MAKKKQEIKEFTGTISAKSWNASIVGKRKTAAAERVRGGYSYVTVYDHDVHWWFKKQVEKITNAIFKKGKLPDKFQLTLKIPRIIEGATEDVHKGRERESGPIDLSTSPSGCYDWAKTIKRSFRDGDSLRFAGLKMPQYGFSNRFKQTRSVCITYDVRDKEIFLIAKYKLRAKKAVTRRKNLSRFAPSLPFILIANTEIIYNGDLSEPGTEVKIEAKIRSMSGGDLGTPNLTNLKYTIDLEKRKIIERKSGKTVKFENQDKLFDKLAKDIK